MCWFASLYFCVLLFLFFFCWLPWTWPLMEAVRQFMAGFLLFVREYSFVFLFSLVFSFMFELLSLKCVLPLIHEELQHSLFTLTFKNIHIWNNKQWLKTWNSLLLNSYMRILASESSSNFLVKLILPWWSLSYRAAQVLQHL